VGRESPLFKDKFLGEANVSRALAAEARKKRGRAGRCREDVPPITLSITPKIAGASSAARRQDSGARIGMGRRQASPISPRGLEGRLRPKSGGQDPEARESGAPGEREVEPRSRWPGPSPPGLLRTSPEANVNRVFINFRPIGQRRRSAGVPPMLASVQDRVAATG
jgi:hypothetical protein